MKQIIEILTLLWRAFIGFCTGKPCRLHLPEKEHTVPNLCAADGRFVKTADGVYTNGKDTNEAQILLLGDLLCQRKQQNAYKNTDGNFDFTPMFAPMENTFRQADMVIGNLETVCDASLAYMHESITADGLPFLNAPPQFLLTLKNAGIDAVCSANNHNCDGGAQGLRATLDCAKKVGLPVTGIFTNENEKRYLLFDINGIRVAFIAYATFYNFKSASVSKEQRKTVLNLYSATKAQKDIADAKKDGAEFVITYIHWGSEYTHKVNRKQKQIAKELAAAGSDLIAGSHSHVLQPFDHIDGVPCLYSFGNFISSQDKDGTQETVILQLTLQKENNKVTVKQLVGVPCRTLVSEQQTEHRTVTVSKTENEELYNRIAKTIGNKLPLVE